MRRSQPRAISAPITSCHQARSAGSSPLRSARRSHQRASAWRPPIATTLSVSHRVAAVGEGDEGAGPVAAAAQHAKPRRSRRSWLGAEGSSMSPPGPHREDLRGAARRQPRRRRRADRPLVPALGQLLDLLAQLAADEDVQLVALAQLGRAARRDRRAVADDHVDQRLARQARVRAPGARPPPRRVAAGRRRRRRPCGGSAPTRAGAAAARARRWSAPAAWPAARSSPPGPGSR